MSGDQEKRLTPERIMQLAWGYAPPLIIEAAIRHHVFDILESGPQSVGQVEAASGASVRGLTAIMNALVGLGLLSKQDERYGLTPESAAFLISGKSTFFGGIFRHCSEQLIPAWLHLNEVVATGRPATAVNVEQTGGEFFHDLVEDIFPMSYAPAQCLAAALDLSGDAPVPVLDLAAGSGVWGLALAQACAQVTVTAVDWPEVLPVTRKVATRLGLAERYRFVAGDLLSVDFGHGHRVATLGHILHSEGEERSAALLKRTFDALAPGGVVAIAEFLVNEDRTGPPMGLLFAVNMLVNTERGGTYAFGEICTWLTAAGFVDCRLLEAPGPSPLILATKPWPSVRP